MLDDWTVHARRVLAPKNKDRRTSLLMSVDLAGDRGTPASVQTCSPYSSPTAAASIFTSWFSAAALIGFHLRERTLRKKQ